MVISILIWLTFHTQTNLRYERSQTDVKKFWNSSQTRMWAEGAVTLMRVKYLSFIPDTDRPPSSQEGVGWLVFAVKRVAEGEGVRRRLPPVVYRETR